VVLWISVWHGEWAINRGSAVDPVNGMVSGLSIEVVLWIQCMAW
jgi:hypothetical protein